MSASLPRELRCPSHLAPLALADESGADNETGIRGSCGCVFAIRKGIPRFVPDSGYADAFGVQWNAFPKTQLDSYTGTSISRDRLTRCLGGTLDGLRGRSVLEVGCGAGRFTEILLDAGASVFACDLSKAVEANRENCGRAAGYFVCQANVVNLPVAPVSFDVVIALGMIQHTPSPEATITALAGAVRPGGILVIDHYRTPRPLIGFLYLFTPRAILRQVFLRVQPATALRAIRVIVRALLPIHRSLWRRGAVADRVRRVWRLMSPVFDYYDSYPELGEHLNEWALLDTHDALTDHYKHLRAPEDIARALRAAGLEVIESRPGGNGVEARARRPPA
jgi:SAM-dependent methyltransferase